MHNRLFIHYLNEINENECPHCRDSGWRWIDLPGSAGMQQCKCVAEKARALSLMRKDPGGNWYLTGAYGNGKTHLLYAQYREIVISGKVCCHVRTIRELVEELRRAEFDDDFVSPVIAAASRREPYHLFWDDLDKLKMTDFKTEVLFDLVDSLYCQKNGPAEFLSEEYSLPARKFNASEFFHSCPAH
jgi:DNA replication protein DnaC